MYLEAKKYIYSGDDSSISKLAKGMAGVDYEIKNITMELAYWRKFNALHNAFMEEVDDEAREVYIESEKFLDILERMKRVQGDHTLAEETLPTASGFFFGSLEYDDDYFDSIDNTIILFEKLLKDDIFDKYDIYYTSSW